MKNPWCFWSWLVSLTALLCGAGLVQGDPAAEPVRQTQANVMIELPFTASRGYKDPFNDVTLDVTFTDPKGHEMRVPAFWDGKNIWKVRYASPLVGTHTFQTDYADPADTGLHAITGKVEIQPYAGSNPLYLHGPLRLAANRRTLEHADGIPFFWLGDTWWMGLCHRLHWPDEFKALAADRVAKGFSVIQIVAGLYPDMPPFDPRGANEAGFPWEPDYARMRPEYFDAADKRLGHLVDSGLTPCIVGAWGYFLPMMGVEKAKRHWRYLVARYGAWPVVWCVAGEANLPYYRAKGFPYDDREQVKGWTQVTRYLRGMDPFHRLITIHPTGIGRLSARHAIDDASLLDIDMLQTPHGRRDAVAPTVNTVRQSYADKPILPVIDGEASYEMLGDSLPTMWTRRMFWLCMMNGAAGHTYGANGIWQCNRRGTPHGPSPTAGSPPTGYGVISWDDAMNLPGSRQEGLGKKLLEQYKWQDFQPHPEWAAFSSKAAVTLEGSQWIWFPEGNPARDTPAARRYFRRNFVLPPGKIVKSAQLRISADDRFAARLNGKVLGTSTAGEAESWRTPRQFNDIGRLLKTGNNILAIEAENLPAPGANPAGLIAALHIEFAGGESMGLVSDNAWRASKGSPPAWDTAAFDDAGWEKAIAVAKYGELPWGDIDKRREDVFGPQSTGIPGLVRVVYVPESQAIVVSGLSRNATYSGIYFDPVSGVKTALPQAHSNGSGLWTCPPPDGCDHDWVLMLDEKHQPVR
jgi:hypothetical protein